MHRNVHLLIVNDERTWTLIFPYDLQKPVFVGKYTSYNYKNYITIYFKNCNQLNSIQAYKVSKNYIYVNVEAVDLPSRYLILDLQWKRLFVSKPSSKNRFEWL